MRLILPSLGKRRRRSDAAGWGSLREPTWPRPTSCSAALSRAPRGNSAKLSFV